MKICKNKHISHKEWRTFPTKRILLIGLDGNSKFPSQTEKISAERRSKIPHENAE